MGVGWFEQFDGYVVIVCELITHAHWSRRLASFDYQGRYLVGLLLPTVTHVADFGVFVVDYWVDF